MVRKRSRVRVPPSAPLKKATVYRAFFIFQNFKNQLTKFDWLSEKRPLAVRYIVKFRLNFRKIHLPFPTCQKRPKTPYFSPIGYIWLSDILSIKGNGRCDCGANLKRQSLAPRITQGERVKL